MTIVLSIGYILFLGTYAFVQVRQLWRRNEKPEAWVYAVYMTASAVIGALLLAEVELPTLVLPYKIVFEPIGKLLLSP